MTSLQFKEKYVRILLVLWIATLFSLACLPESSRGNILHDVYKSFMDLFRRERITIEERRWDKGLLVGRIIVKELAYEAKMSSEEANRYIVLVHGDDNFEAGCYHSRGTFSGRLDRRGYFFIPNIDTCGQYSVIELISILPGKAQRKSFVTSKSSAQSTFDNFCWEDPVLVLGEFTCRGDSLVKIEGSENRREKFLTALMKQTNGKQWLSKASLASLSSGRKLRKSKRIISATEADKPVKRVPEKAGIVSAE